MGDDTRNGTAAATTDRIAERVEHALAGLRASVDGLATRADLLAAEGRFREALVETAASLRFEFQAVDGELRHELGELRVSTADAAGSNRSRWQMVAAVATLVAGAAVGMWAKPAAQPAIAPPGTERAVAHSAGGDGPSE